MAQSPVKKPLQGKCTKNLGTASLQSILTQGIIRVSFQVRP